jgi:glycosyltransferase involved in cell wall biosynthesis
MGLDNLLRAIVLVKKYGYGLHVAIGGSGSLRSKLEKMRNELGLEDDVTFMGFMPADSLPLAYGACDASVIPTAQLECFGIIALEALACGCTTLVTPVGALPEVMQNFEPAWIARDATSEGIANILLAFLRKLLPYHEPQELHNLVEQNYSAEKAVNAYERLLLQ